MEEDKSVVAVQNEGKTCKCNDSPCTKVYAVQNENHATSGTLE